MKRYGARKICGIRTAGRTRLLALLLAALALCGCGSGGTAGGGAAGTGGKEAGAQGTTGPAGVEDGKTAGEEDRGIAKAGDGRNADAGKGAGAAGELTFLAGTDMGGGCSTEAGYYYLTEEAAQLADGSYGMHLMYMDFASRREIFLCSTAGCRHDSLDCPAVFSCEEFPALSTRIFVYGDFLYILSREYDDDGTLQTDMTFSAEGEVQAETRAAALYRADLDGTGREKLYTFDPAFTLEEVVLGGESGIYVVTKKLSADAWDDAVYTTSAERKLQCFRPETGKLEEVCSLNLGDGISWQIVGCGGGSLILRGTDFGRELSREELFDEDAYKEFYENSSDVYGRLTLEDGIVKELYRAPNGREHSGRVLGDHLYLSFAGSTEILAVGLLDGKEETLCSLPQNQIMGNLGEVLCLRDWDLAGDQTWYFVDTATGETGHNGLVNKNNGWSLEFKAETASDVLMVHDYDAEKNGDGSYTIDQYRHALISKEDLFSGREDYREIEMIGRGQ